ncbi:MAG: phosphatase [Leptolyngbyaceae cyanobacterium CRU_2_3]|nr:phosphatase [Leptolyngbyaceae cyanobacterium CRU_2_3]
MSTNSLEEIYNFIQITDLIATAGQPTVEQFTTIKDAGYEMIVNLAPPNATNAIAHEQEIVEAQGIAYAYIPVIWEHPTLEDLDRFFQVMQANQQRKVFVHCAKNMRVSAFTYLYQVTQLHSDPEIAKVEMDKIWTPNPIWQDFIQQAMQHYQPGVT